MNSSCQYIKVAPMELLSLSFNKFTALIYELLQRTINSNGEGSPIEQQILISINNFIQAPIIAGYIARLVELHLMQANCNSHVSSKMIEIGFNELLINSLEHGILGINYNLKSKLLSNNQWENYINHALLLQPLAKVVDLYLRIVPRANKMYILVEDPGTGFDHTNFTVEQLPEISEKHGRGHVLIALLPDLKYYGIGNKVSFSIPFDVNFFINQLK